MEPYAAQSPGTGAPTSLVTRQVHCCHATGAQFALDGVPIRQHAPQSIYNVVHESHGVCPPGRCPPARRPACPPARLPACPPARQTYGSGGGPTRLESTSYAVRVIWPLDPEPGNVFEVVAIQCPQTGIPSNRARCNRKVDLATTRTPDRAVQVGCDGRIVCAKHDVRLPVSIKPTASSHNSFASPPRSTLLTPQAHSRRLRDHYSRLVTQGSGLPTIYP